MDLFHQIPDGQAVLYAKGTYKQADLYRRGERVFVKNGGGFARIEGTTGTMWGTSLPSLMVVEYQAPNLKKGRFGEPLYRA